jgi:Flp pilus assembly pilin Flp
VPIQAQSIEGGGPMLRFLRIVHKLQHGASLVEYGLLVLLIALVAILAVTFAGNQNSALWSEIASSVDL